MNMFSKVLALTLVMVDLVGAAPLTLQDGVNNLSEVPMDSPALKLALDLEDITFGQTDYKFGLLLGYTDLNLGHEYFLLFDSLHLARVNIDTNSFLKAWPLTRWPYQYYSPDIKDQFAEMYTEYPLPFEYETVGPGPGCLGESPLRYGDIEGDGAKEIVVILDGLFIIFSPGYQRTVFSEYLDESDWYNDAEMEELFSEENITVTQYVSRLWAENSNMRGPGVRAYGKLYFGDFDEDGNSDILAWRKSYRSNAGDDPVKGFTKLRDSWGHYERDLKAQAETTQGVTGDYLPQDTDPALIQEWLTNNQLTWSKGWPSTSECEGQEGKLIPEMHDPLLNDPDVLK